MEINVVSTIKMLTEPIQKHIQQERLNMSHQVSPRNHIGTFTPEEESITE